MKIVACIVALWASGILSASESLFGTPEIESMGVLTFNEEGILFVGDSKAGAVYAIDLSGADPGAQTDQIAIDDLEGQVAGLLGTDAENVLIHDLAVHPISQEVFMSVSRARAQWTSKWHLPNDLASADILLKIDGQGEISEAVLKEVSYSKISLPNPVADGQEHRWKKGTMTRVDAITSLHYRNGRLYIAGLSNEEFAASMWVANYPFTQDVTATTLEIYHAAHGEYETHAPIRTFLPYTLDDEEHIIAAYLCTPLVTFKSAELKDGMHVKGSTVAEFGSGNYPLDMVVYQNKGKDYILMSNSQLPLMIVDPADVQAFEGSITEKPDSYMAGVRYTPRSGSGVQQLADYSEQYLLATQRMPNGKLALVPLSKEWLKP